MNSQCAQRELVLERTHSKACNRRFEQEQFSLVRTHFTDFFDAQIPVRTGDLGLFAPMHAWFEQIDFASKGVLHSDALVERIKDTIQRLP